LETKLSINKRPGKSAEGSQSIICLTVRKVHKIQGIQTSVTLDVGGGGDTMGQRQKMNRGRQQPEISNVP